MNQYVEHCLKPIYDENSKILILGTMPSPKSRENHFYYAHPQNRFWKILSELFHEKLPADNNERKELLIRHHIALWDVLHSCTISGADDSSIKKPEANDIRALLDKTNITAVFTTGTKAYTLYNQLCFAQTQVKAHPLPSTSPANRRYYTYEDILTEYSVLLAYVQ